MSSRISSPICVCRREKGQIGKKWQKSILHIDPERGPDRAKRAWESHARAKWLRENGYRHLLRGGAPH